MFGHFNDRSVEVTLNFDVEIEISEDEPQITFFGVSLQTLIGLSSQHCSSFSASQFRPMPPTYTSPLPLHPKKTNPLKPKLSFVVLFWGGMGGWEEIRLSKDVFTFSFIFSIPAFRFWT